MLTALLLLAGCAADRPPVDETILFRHPVTQRMASFNHLRGTDCWRLNEK